jgi:mRNA-degrading endonuclease RelE of RelBE toxin-antitoxin system
MPSLRVAQPKGAKKTSMPGASSKQSTKQQGTPPSDIPKPDAPGWHVELQPQVARTVARLGITNADFNPTIAELILELERDPKQFPKKTGKLAAVRAAPLRYRDAAWRVVFTLNEREKVVVVIALDKHDEAYRDAGRRV